MKIDLIAGARPNFVKIASLIEAIKKQKGQHEITFRLIHTGQHYDKNMSDNFFSQLRIPEPDINLRAGGGSQAQQAAEIMIGYEKLLMESKPDVCVVVGDVTSTMACAITAQKMLVKVAHVEAGIRSGDWSMPEEINRLVTDSITNYFYTTSSFADENLLSTGVPKDRITRVGNTMIDTLFNHKEKFIKPQIWQEINLKSKEFIVLTLHRPANVDDYTKLNEMIHEIVKNSRNFPIIFPVHPRTRKILQMYSIKYPNLFCIEPLSYLEFNYLVERAVAVITDSGGITEETTVLGVPCLTLRDNTERPETIIVGTNELLGTNPNAIGPALDTLFEGKWKKGNIPDLWDGHAAERIITHLLSVI